jgi:HEAT repeat protein
MRHGAKWVGVPLSGEIASEGTSMNDNQRRADTAPYWNSAVEVTGPRRSDHRRASDTRETSELISAYLRASDDSEAADLITTIQYRGGAEEFRAGLALLTSKDSRERAAGAEILGQLGWQDRTFLEESVNALLGALIDTDDHVLQSVIFALGHRADPRAIEALLPFVDNPSADIRYATVHGLMPHDVPNVVAAMAKLTRDSDRDVRNWATFTLGSQFESKSPTLCAALQERVTDSDPEIRGEALLGLARRGDVRIAPFVQLELDGEFHGDWAIDAAGLLAAPGFLPALKGLLVRLKGEDVVYFRGSIESAIAACEGRRVHESHGLQ